MTGSVVSSLAKAASDGRKYTRIEGRYYDITELISRHPGGQIIESAVGIDATCLFATHHAVCLSGGDSKARQWLASCAVRPGQEKEAAEAVLDGPVFQRSRLFDELTEEIRPLLDRRAGAWAFAAEAAAWGAVLLFTIYAHLAWHSQAASFAAPVVASFFAMVAMHEGTHGGTPVPAVNAAVNLFSIAVGAGGTQRWRFSHIRHHALTSDSHGDPDLYPAEKYIRYVPEMPPRAYHRFQRFYAWAIYLLAAHVFSLEAVRPNPYPTFKDMVFIPRVASRRRVLVERVLGAVAFLLRFGIPLAFLPWRNVALFEVGSLFSAMALSCVFQVNHFTARAINSLPEARARHGDDWAAMQVAASNDFSVDSPFWNHVTGGLNFQIEHHLYPTLNHWHYPVVAAALRRICKRRGIQVSTYASIWEALVDHQRLLVQMGEPAKSA